ncbi:hypothetical protein C8J56DRAFT_1054475 [Mycena floridula]|nr:hypothetical protein C8J56DRAFT_1054475 [Mycena floridula]
MARFEGANRRHPRHGVVQGVGIALISVFGIIQRNKREPSVHQLASLVVIGNSIAGVHGPPSLAALSLPLVHRAVSSTRPNGKPNLGILRDVFPRSALRVSMVALVSCLARDSPHASLHSPYRRLKGPYGGRQVFRGS